MFMLDNLIRDIRSIMNSVVIKYEKNAKVMETLDIVKESDMYISATLQQDSFNSYIRFDLDLIMSSGVNDPLVAQTYYENKSLIPSIYREIILAKQRARIINDYVEKNNYYRMLNGLPDIDDIEVIYVDSEICIANSLTPNTPIHLYPLEDIYTLMYIGEIDKLILKYPTKKYLLYLGPNQIDIVQARTAKNFMILRMTSDISDSLYAQFNDFYLQSREYFMTVLYIKEYAKTYELYDNFMAMMIMVMTIQKTAVNLFKNGINRDFYDLDSIKMLLDSYKIPFMVDLPIEYQRALLRNLNNLLRYKSTDKVLYDICSLMGFERMKIFKYFLIKEHIVDENGVPIFLYKDEVNDEGVTITVEDKENMYNFYFQRINLTEKNIALALTDDTMKVDYDIVTTNDPYWWEDENLKNTLLTEDFNYIESKYMNMNLMYHLSEMLFEIIYVFRLIIDKKDSIEYITIRLSNMFLNKPIKLFDTLILLCALIAKRDHMAGNILVDPSKILSILGFNFTNDFKIIQDTIKNNPQVYDQELLTYFENMNKTSPQDINNLFTNIKGLNTFLINKMNTSSSIEEYRAYKNLFTALMVSTESTTLFQKSDGTPALTFKDYFSDHDSIIYDFIDTVEYDKIPGYIDYIIFNLNDLLIDLKYIKFINDTNNPIINAITTLINFFKSYTVNLTDMNIFYILDSKAYNFITLVGDIKTISGIIPLNDDSYLMDSSMISKTISNMESYNSYDTLRDIVSNILVKDNLSLFNTITGFSKLFTLNTNLHMVDFLIISKLIQLKDMCNYSDMLKHISTTILNKDKLELLNIIKSITTNLPINDSSLMMDYLLADKVLLIKDTLLILDKNIELIYEPQ